MEKLLTVISAATVLIMATTSYGQQTTANQRHQFSTKIEKSVSLGYLLYLPEDYNVDNKQFPLLVFLHGAGERGNNLDLVEVHGPPKLVKQNKKFPFIIVSPQCPANERWNDDAVMALIDHIIKNYRVDSRRVYLTGLSMGGYGTWSLAAKYPERFAAVAPICGGGNTIAILLSSPQKREAIKTLGIWAFHGAKDPVVPLAESERMVAAFKRAGCQEVKLTVYPEAQHDSWTETYNNNELYDWFLKHTR
ncbi:MAG: prolyl oligopeptidase family serine peptidase [Verrucomicrobiia bacterium]|jgi:predicted peptidase